MDTYSREKIHLQNEVDFLSRLINDHKKQASITSHQFTRRVHSVYPKPSVSNSWHRSVGLAKKPNTWTRPQGNFSTIGSSSRVVVDAKGSRLVRNLRITKSNVWKRTTTDAVVKTSPNTVTVTQSAGGVTSRSVGTSTAAVTESSPSSRLVSVKGDDMTVKIKNKQEVPTAVPQEPEKPALQRKRTVCAPTKKEAETVRTVLKSSRYKWAAKEKPAAKSNLLTPVLQKAKRTPGKRVISFSPYKCVKNLSSTLSKFHTPPTKEKSIRTKYKLIKRSGGRRTSQSGGKFIKTKYKIVNRKSPKISPYKFVRKVGKYSIQYVKVRQSTSSSRSSSATPSARKAPKYKSPFAPRSSSKYMKYHLIKRVSKEVQTVTSPFSKLVIIGGILYRSSPMHLSKTSKKINTIKVTKLNEKKASVITVRGVKFFMDHNGKALKRVDSKLPVNKSGASRFSKVNVSRVDLGGKTYIQREPGILVQSQTPQTRSLAKRVVNRSINHLAAARRKSTQFCMFYNLFGKCRKHDEGKCPYIHDADKVAVCRRFLQGKCSVEKCPFSHTICRSKMPTCSFFLRGRCSNDDCPYSHVNVNPDAEICQDFLKGYCPRATDCKKLHTFSCPEFERKGSCSKGDKCTLKHIKTKKQGNKRKLPDDGASEEAKVAKTAPAPDRCVEAGDEDEADDGGTKSTGRLPSFIKLSEDESEAEVNPDTPVLHPLRIKPSFLSQK